MLAYWIRVYHGRGEASKAGARQPRKAETPGRGGRGHLQRFLASPVRRNQSSEPPFNGPAGISFLFLQVLFKDKGCLEAAPKANHPWR